MRSDEMEDCGCTIENFIRKGEQDKPNDSICREERQYAGPTERTGGKDIQGLRDFW